MQHKFYSIRNEVTEFDGDKYIRFRLEHIESAILVHEKLARSLLLSSGDSVLVDITVVKGEIPPPERTHN